MICFSSKSNEFDHAVKIATFLKKKLDIPFFCGGIHPTIYPEDSLRECFDGICVGEGEEALSEILEKMEHKEDYSNTRGFWFRRNGKIIKNPLRPLIKNLDILPLFDYDLFDIRKYLLFIQGAAEGARDLLQGKQAGNPSVQLLLNLAQLQVGFYDQAGLAVHLLQAALQGFHLLAELGDGLHLLQAEENDKNNQQGEKKHHHQGKIHFRAEKGG